MKTVDYIFFLLFGWTCAVCAAAFAVVCGVPWEFALAHTLTSCVIGSAISTLLLNLVEFFVKRKWPTLVASATLPEADAAKSEPQSS